MKNTFRYIAAAALCLAAVACYKEDPITSELGEPAYTVTDGSDSMTHYIYETWQKTGVFILTDYTSKDYVWNVSALSKNVLSKVDASVLPDAVSAVKTALFDVYSDSFKKQYFPMKVFLAESLTTSYASNVPAGYGRSYLVAAGLSSETLPMSAEAALAYKGKINAMLWGYFIYMNRLIDIPEGFFSPCADVYEASYERDTNKDVAGYINSIGFWRYDETNIVYAHMAPSRAKDVADFVEMITTHTKSEMDALMDGFPILYMKYNILLEAVKTACGIDLQAIGDAK